MPTSPFGENTMLTGSKRNTIRAEVNPMDKCTVFSIFPKDINEVKHTIQPGYFHIDKGSYEKPARLVVGSSSWWRDIDFEQPLLEIPVSSVQVANSIVRDYVNGLLACNMSDTMPGLFFVPGDIGFVKLRLEYSEALETAKVKQTAWFSALVEMADTLWAKSHGNPLVIAQDMRLAAEQLGVDGVKSWMVNQRAADLIRCIACGSFRNPLFPICGTCQTIIDPEQFKKLGLQLATK